VSPGQDLLHEGNLVAFVVAADDVQADDVVGKIDEQPNRTFGAFELLEDDRPVVRVGEVAVLLSEFTRRHQVIPKLSRVARPGELRADDILVLRIAVEQQAVGPDDVFAREAAGMWGIHRIVMLWPHRHPIVDADRRCLTV
jgi:hypothetical protein